LKWAKSKWRTAAANPKKGQRISGHDTSLRGVQDIKFFLFRLSKIFA